MERNTGKGSGPRKVLPVRFAPEELDRLELAAMSETGGNVSEFVRRAVAEKINRKLRAA